MNQTEGEIIIRWEDDVLVSSQNYYEEMLYQQLIEEKFLVRDSKEEKLLEQKTMADCRNAHFRYLKSLDHIVFVLTYMCNFSCPYCY